MPFITFDYKCTNEDCEQEFESKMVLRSDMDAQRCDECGDQLRRLPAGTRTTFRFADTKLKE